MALRMSLSLVIFDLDGTLADTLADISAAMNRVLADFGLPTHPTARYARYVGEGVARLAERVLPPERQDLHARVTEAFRADYSEHLVVESAPYPGIPELLDALAARGVEIAVLSNKPQALTQRVVDALFAGRTFRAVVGQQPEVPKKPDPSAALAIAGDAGARPGSCALVGDTPTDIHTARAAGIMAIGVQWGFRRRDDLESAGADAVIEAPPELLPFLTKS